MVVVLPLITTPELGAELTLQAAVKSNPSRVRSGVTPKK
jgi:hypothetical protein